MVLSDSAIFEGIKSGDIVISPFNPKHVNPNSVDLTLDNILRVYKEDTVLDPKKHNPTDEIELSEEGIILYPGILYLASTVEKAGTKTYSLTVLHHGVIQVLSITGHLKYQLFIL
jgi:dCTP deaminase